MNTTRTKIFKDNSEYTEFKKQPNIKIMGVFIATENDVTNNPDEDLVAGKSIFISYQVTSEDYNLHDRSRSDNYGNRGNFGKFGY
jgi:hypothetical protein